MKKLCIIFGLLLTLMNMNSFGMECVRVVYEFDMASTCPDAMQVHSQNMHAYIRGDNEVPLEYLSMCVLICGFDDCIGEALETVMNRFFQ